MLDLLFWSTEGSHDPAWDIQAKMVDAKDIYGIRYAYIQFPQVLIGRASLITFGENGLLFRVASTGSNPNPTAISMQNLLIEHDLLMLPNVADIQVVLDNSFRRLRPTL
jgi:hypothetical protein